MLVFICLKQSGVGYFRLFLFLELLRWSFLSLVLTGASAPNPDLLFASLEFIYFGVGDFRFAPIVLTQKVSKKHLTRPPVGGHPLQWEREKGRKCLTAPASLEKLALSWLKPSKLAPSSLKLDSFKRQLHLFFGSPDEDSRCKIVCSLISLLFLLKISIKCTTG